VLATILSNASALLRRRPLASTSANAFCTSMTMSAVEATSSRYTTMSYNSVAITRRDRPTSSAS
jgi:hypothetical protein